MSCQICVGGDVISRENLLRDCEKVVTFGQLLVLDFTRWVNREQEEGETGSSGGPGAPRVPRGIAVHNFSAVTTTPDAPAPRALQPAHDLRHFLFRTYVCPYRVECRSLRVPLHQRHLRCHRFDRSV